jgi:hypothetical protein
MAINQQAVINPNRPDGRVDAQTQANRVRHPLKLTPGTHRKT